MTKVGIQRNARSSRNITTTRRCTTWSSSPRRRACSCGDTLLVALQGYVGGPRVIQLRICLALAAMALQMGEEQWPDVVGGMMQRFGNEPQTVGLLLEFLTVLPEEITSNHRIPIEVSLGLPLELAVEHWKALRRGRAHAPSPNATQSDMYRTRVQQILGNSVDEVLKRLSMYISAQGESSARARCVAPRT